MNTLIQSVAQRLIVGMRGDRFYDLLGAGVGGFIAFAPDVIDLTPGALHQRLAMLQASRPADTLPLWLAVDQEGGPVERLTVAQCPGLPSFQALSRLGPEGISRAVTAQAQALANLGFNLNFSPCLDVNTEPTNPVIGVRSFSANPKVVAACAHPVIKVLLQAGLLPVSKHFPGHGDGQVDSHECLPTLTLSAEHLAPYIALIDHSDRMTGLPAIMMAHGYYPGACETPETPASLSPRVIQQLLRQQLGFDGLVMTDDLQMGAIAGKPEDVAIQALAAGNDVLLYREAGEREWAVLHAVVHALQTGQLNIRQHHEALERIEAAKRLINDNSATQSPTNDSGFDNLTAEFARQVLLTQSRPVFTQPLTLLHPYTPDLHGYRLTPPDTLPSCLCAVGLNPTQAKEYTPLAVLPCDFLPTVFVASHLTRCPHQHDMAKQVLAHGGAVFCLGWMPDDLTGVIQLPGYQVPAIQALAQWLAKV